MERKFLLSGNFPGQVHMANRRLVFVQEKDGVSGDRRFPNGAPEHASQTRRDNPHRSWQPSTRRRNSAKENYLETTNLKMAANITVSTKADRALNKAMNKEAYNNDLLQDIENGKTRLSRVKEEELPADLKAIPAERRADEIEKRISERKKIRQEILDLSKQREAYPRAEKQKSGKKNGFDTAVGNALSERLTGKGID